MPNVLKGYRVSSENPREAPAYRCAIYGLIPVAGLFLGPAAIVLGFIGLLRQPTDPKKAYGIGPARAAILLGTLELITNGVGLTFIGIGLVSIFS